MKGEGVRVSAFKPGHDMGPGAGVVYRIPLSRLN
jgi:hypothetical protein